ncbi:hypothetical protein GCM10027038_43070 [Arthrobacter bambusae]
MPVDAPVMRAVLAEIFISTPNKLTANKLTVRFVFWPRVEVFGSWFAALLAGNELLLEELQ